MPDSGTLTAQGSQVYLTNDKRLDLHNDLTPYARDPALHSDQYWEWSSPLDDKMP